MLRDAHGRTHTYLRLAVTDRCNLRCRYCMPEQGIAFAPRAALLTFEEIVRVCDVMAKLGVTKVRLTGGEPLVRRELPELVRFLTARFPRVAMTTNGVLLPPVLDQLLADGLTHYNLSLDSLRPERFRRITRRDDFAAARAALDALLAAGATTKLNVVVLRGHNDDELGDFLQLCSRGPAPEVRFIEAMPFNDDDGNHHLFLSAAEILDRIRALHPGLYPEPADAHASAQRYRIPGYPGAFALVPAYSRSLCGSCNRLRLTPRGTLLNCLYSRRGPELLPLLRGGATDDDLAALITDYVTQKAPHGHATEAREQSGNVFASMTSIGG